MDSRFEMCFAIEDGETPRLKTSRFFPYEIRFEMILRGVEAWDPETGAYLTASRGRSRNAPKWFLFFNDCATVNGEWRPYREWRTVFHAWDRREALEIAEEKLAALVAKDKAHVTGFMSTDFDRANKWRNQQVQHDIKTVRAD